MSFSTGLSSLRAHQTALSVVGNNIANASTEGFRREEVIFTENPHVQIGGFSIGTGVSVNDIRGAGDAILEEAILDNTSQNATLNAQFDAVRQLEALFLPGTGNIQERMSDLFLDMERLSAIPTDATLRSAVVHSADRLAQEVNRVSGQLDDLISNAETQLDGTIAEINELSAKISSLNTEILDRKNQGLNAPGLVNQRDLFLKELATLIDVEKRVSPAGQETYLMGGGMFTVDSGLTNMELIRNADGELEVWKDGCDTPFKITGGKLGGIFEQINGDGGIGHVRNLIDEFTVALTAALDTAHATGVGIGGAHTNLTSGRRIAESDVPISLVETITPVSAGTLYISVTDETTGTNTLEQIAFDPDIHSLDDFATSVSAIDHLSASVDSLGRISITAESGYSFDFTGNLQSFPDASSITGTTVPEISGRYGGQENELLRFEFLGSGTIGVTENLQVAVIDQANQTVRVLDVGTEYEPGSKLVVGDGVEVTFTTGTANVGDSFQVQTVGQPDETGVLTATGLNTLFVGRNANTLAINPIIAENPSKLATTSNGEPSDNRNLHRMLSVREDRLLRDGTLTLEQFLSDLVADIGNEALELERDIASNEEHTAFLEGELESISGVDVNEELAKMLQYQRAYQAAARYIAAIDETLQDLLQIV